MGEAISLVVMWAGIGLGMYSLGLPIEWVVVLLLAGWVAMDLLLLRSTRRRSSIKARREPMEATPKKSTLDESTESNACTETAWKKFSVLRVPANPGLNDTTVHAVVEDVKHEPLSAPAPAPPSPRLEVSRAATVPDRAQPSTTNPNCSELFQTDPLAIYRPEQFDERPRAAPVVASSPPVAISPSIAPTGPAYVPPVVQAVRERAARAPGTPGPPRPILKPEDFTRNAGKRGFLYLARNPEHWDGLFKVGQTLRHPRFRVQELNALHAKHKDIGTFELLDVVEVSDAYGAEQVLFLVLSDLRPVAGREFFIANKAYLSKVMRAVADFISGRPEKLNNLYRGLDPNDFPPWPGKTPWYRRRHPSGANGWVYLARCQYHLAATYLFGATRMTPEAEVAKLNDGQRSDTPQIGFYTVVFALPVWDTQMSRAIGWRALASWRLPASRSFIRGPLGMVFKTPGQARMA
ncbi:GIY-YIG nuclease family protein [Hydrogenophaga sp. MI9]|uniref:GIY-YIG nuclease family protein n=1 Tax=Hydrogenophaga sp. MI9 TaxID=3453719 RepID=UPI003EEFA696